MPDSIFLYIIFLLLIGLYGWLFIHDRKIRGSGEDKEPLIINVNISQGGDSKSYETDTSSSSSSPVKKEDETGKQKIGEIPIEEPDRSTPKNDWLNINAEDSNL